MERKSFSLRRRIFWGFILVTLLTLVSSSVISYVLLRSNAMEQNATAMQKEANAIMASLDYAIANQQEVKTSEIPLVLKNKILEIADINKQDIIIYDLKGQYLISSKDDNLVDKKNLPKNLLLEVLGKQNRIDVQEYDENLKVNKTSSYLLLRDNFLDPIGIVYFPYYHNDGAYLNILNTYIQYILLVNLFIILIEVWLSWVVSRNLTKSITKFSKLITEITLFDKKISPLKYYHNDELGMLVKAYNRMILQIQDQRSQLIFTEREGAWREMAKQVAHEVKNPLTPMKLTMQNFERKFNPENPDIKEDVKKLTSSMVGNIDLIARVADAFSQFARLPERNDEDIELNQEIENILNVFSDEKIHYHSNKTNIAIKMDKVYLGRIITNLVKNAIQAKSNERESIVNIEVESVQKRIKITVEDNGKGIPEEMIPKIFEPNFTSKSSGMGLGLTMVKKMIEDYQGAIEFSSTEGIGTVFTISLPNGL